MWSALGAQRDGMANTYIKYIDTSPEAVTPEKWTASKWVREHRNECDWDDQGKVWADPVIFGVCLIYLSRRSFHRDRTSDAR